MQISKELEWKKKSSPHPDFQPCPDFFFCRLFSKNFKISTFQKRQKNDTWRKAKKNRKWGRKPPPAPELVPISSAVQPSQTSFLEQAWAQVWLLHWVLSAFKKLFLHFSAVSFTIALLWVACCDFFSCIKLFYLCICSYIHD